MDDQRQKIAQRIIDLKCHLESRESDIGDWKLSKYQEYVAVGKEAPFDIQEYAAARQAVRDEINQLEAELQKI